MTPSVEKDALVVDLSDVPFIDTSAAMALEEVITGMREAEDAVVLCGMRDLVRETLAKTGVLGLLVPDRIVATRVEALRAARDFLGAAQSAGTAV